VRSNRGYLRGRRLGQLFDSATLAVAVTGVLQHLYVSSVRRLVRHAVARIRQGDVRPLVMLYAKEVRFVFPGTSSWAADFAGRREAQRWLQRFVRVGFQLETQEILVGGPPWRTTVAVRFTDRFFDADGSPVYSNEGMMFARASWGRIRLHVVYEDTERGAEFENWLTDHRPELARAA
jgi:ketosteroid isomerase-like protein